jgi:lipid-A-disaccharide synthase
MTSHMVKSSQDFHPPLPAARSGSVDLLLIAGEHSGDEHAAKLLEELLERDPNLQVACLGGRHLAAAGAQLLYDLSAVSVVGFVEVLKRYAFFKSLFEATLDWIETHRPRQICFVDYPGFNLRIAQQLHARGLSRQAGGAISLYYYIGPQVWAWKAKRRFKMANMIDQLGVIFPFEVNCFADTCLPTAFVGHPFTRSDYTLPFYYEATAPILLLPGSRVGAVCRIFPHLLKAFEHAWRQRPQLTACVVYPSDSLLQHLQQMLADFPHLESAVSFRLNTELGLPASGVLMSSGTMSLACALSGIPGAIVYSLNPISYWIGKCLVKVPYIGISNLLLKRPLHPEYIQKLKPAVLGAEILRVVGDPNAVVDAQASASELQSLLRPQGCYSVADWLTQDDCTTVKSSQPI